MEKFNALWDTGASATVITQKVVDALGLKPISMTNVVTAAGPGVAEVLRPVKLKPVPGESAAKASPNRALTAYGCFSHERHTKVRDRKA